ncbi:MAG: DUF1565 domain-containing protein, partial [Candidatus Eisenbacteria sp.]|nr:DUF1565 domain-containing protein [Candidatus Eisenbacteria bacterium]
SIHIDVGSSDCLIDSNTVSDGINGIQLWSDDCTVTNNTIYDMGKTYADTKTTDDGTYYNSAILYGDIYNVNTPTSATISYNNIYDNYWGLFVYNGTVTAENNWWGNASGPADAASYGTSGYEAYGDAVSTYVDYEPWLLKGWETATTYDKTLALKGGWTLVSTDNRITAGDSEWVGKTLAYTYTVSGSFATATLTDLRPVDALYVKTVGGGGVGITYSGGVPVASSKDLEAGWNLISSATATAADTVLSPLRYVQVGEEQGVGLATLVSQGNYNQFTGAWYVDATIWENVSGTMSPFDGYWVYMNAAKSFGVIPN